ncbi:MAG: hypothetical protein JSS37_00065 [Proteobacteria bacterium]|nr:hypothetical protein [Pseudomonadota bacterium]
MHVILLVISLTFSSVSNFANAEGLLSRILDPQADIKEQIDKARANQEAKKRERQPREDEKLDRLAHEQEARTLLEARGKPLMVTYRHIPANIQAIACSDPMQQADCKIYFAGFAHTVDMIFAMNPSMKGVCGDVADLIHEFVHEVRTNLKAREAETHMVLLALLARDHSCAKIRGRIQNPVSAGYLMDMCHAGDFGFNVCSQYQAGFISALLLLSEQNAEPILCGDSRLIDGVANMLNNRLQANFRLRRDPAVTVMLNELMANMPCSSRIASDTPPEEVAQLIAQEETLNDKCRGGSGDDKATQKACDERDVILKKIEAKNWCWGHDDQIGADRVWERCRK